jgi:hypothetical protein
MDIVTELKSLSSDSELHFILNTLSDYKHDKEFETHQKIYVDSKNLIIIDLHLDNSRKLYTIYSRVRFGRNERHAKKLSLCFSYPHPGTIDVYHRISKDESIHIYQIYRYVLYREKTYVDDIISESTTWGSQFKVYRLYSEGLVANKIKMRTINNVKETITVNNIRHQLIPKSIEIKSYHINGINCQKMGIKINSRFLCLYHKHNGRVKLSMIRVLYFIILHFITSVLVCHSMINSHYCLLFIVAVLYLIVMFTLFKLHRGR